MLVAASRIGLSSLAFKPLQPRNTGLSSGAAGSARCLLSVTAWGKEKSEQAEEIPDEPTGVLLWLPGRVRPLCIGVSALLVQATAGL